MLAYTVILIFTGNPSPTVQVLDPEPYEACVRDKDDPDFIEAMSAVVRNKFDGFTHIEIQCDPIVR